MNRHADRRANMKTRRANKKIARREESCREDYGVYNYTSRRCTKCDPCGDGKGRDFSNPEKLERGEDGSLVCPACQTCAEGFYNNEEKAVVCRKCAVNCNVLNRNVARECSHLGDAVCGSCQKGFVDFYQNTDMPCDEIKSSTTVQAPRVPVQAGNDLRVGPEIEQLPTASRSQQHLDKSLLIGIIVPVCVVIVGLLIAMFLLRFIKSRKASERKRRRHRRNDEISNGGLISRNTSSNALGCDNDLEVDATMVNMDTISQGSFSTSDINTGARLAGYQRQHSREGNFPYRVDPAGPQGREPHPELLGPPMANISGPRAELSRSYITQPEAVQTTSPVYQIPSRKHCSCPQPCRICSGYLDTCSTICLHRGSKTLVNVAEKICHNPISLYHNLGIPDEDIYQIDNDRDRDPERIPERENINKLLNRWVEIKDKEATLRVLCKALCDSGFHHITEKIFQRCET